MGVNVYDENFFIFCMWVSSSFHKSSVLQENDRYLGFLKYSTDDNVFKSLRYVGNNVN